MSEARWMVRYLGDPANAVTMAGLVLSGSALYATIHGHFELAVAISLWSMIMDQLDGVLAGRTRDRSEATAVIGKHLDACNDLIYGAVIPAATVASLGGNSMTTAIVSVAIVCAGALRLSYFNQFGLSGGRFAGLPLSYTGPVLAVLFIARPIFDAPTFHATVTACLALLAALQVSSIPIPAPRGIAYAAIIAVSAFASIALVDRTLFWP
jgi:CDP-diacylglycerol---serine O-phosphatidyltransferase